MNQRLLGTVLGGWVSLLGGGAVLLLPAQAQSVTPALDGTGTLVEVAGTAAEPVYTITGGSASSDGANLFHSFDRFGVTAAETANFVAAPGIETILGRVVGGQASYIDGLVSVTGGTAHLILINPAGLLTGVNGRIEVPATGGFIGTTAASLGFGGGDLDSLGPTNVSVLNGAPVEFRLAADAGAIIHEGTIAPPGDDFSQLSSIQLIGGAVLNAGQLRANDIVLVSGGASQTVVPGAASASLGGNPLGNALPSVASPSQLLQQRLAVPEASQLRVDPDGTIRLEGAAIAVANGSFLSANRINARNLAIVAQGDLVANQALDVGNALQLRALGGDGIVSTLRAGPGGIDVLAAGQFQARGVELLQSFGLSLSSRLGDAPGLVAFLESKGIATAPDQVVRVSYGIDSDGEGTPDVPYSILALQASTALPEGSFNAPVILRYGGATRTLVDQQFPIFSTDGSDTVTQGRILIQGGDGPFFSGPAIASTRLPGVADAFVTSDGTGNLVAVSPATFDPSSPGAVLIPNTVPDFSFPSEQFPATGSGLVAGVVVGFGSNTTLYGVLQDQVFAALPPVVPDPGPTPGPDPAPGPGPVPTAPSVVASAGAIAGSVQRGGTAQPAAPDSCEAAVASQAASEMTPDEATTGAAASSNAPTDSAPTDSAPTDSASTDSASTDSAPTEPSPSMPEFPSMPELTDTPVLRGDPCQANLPVQPIASDRLLRSVQPPSLPADSQPMQPLMPR